MESNFLERTECPACRKLESLEIYRCAFLENPVSPLEHINCFKRSTIFQKAELTGLEPVRISGRITKAYRVNQKPLTAFLKALLKPAYQRIFNRGTYQFLQMK